MARPPSPKPAGAHPHRARNVGILGAVVGLAAAGTAVGLHASRRRAGDGEADGRARGGQADQGTGDPDVAGAVRVLR